MISSFEILDPRLGDALIEAAGQSRFDSLLLETAQQFACVTEIFGYRRTPDGKPQPLLSSSEHGDAEQRAREYVSRFYRNDPALWARRRVASGGFTEHVHASDIALRDYRSICFDRPRLADKLCYGWRDAGEEFVLSFYRARGGELGSLGLLAGLANVALTALVRVARATPDKMEAADSTVERLEDRLLMHFPALSGRERQICARTLVGRTARLIGTELGLTLGTVLTYRQRAYGKLGVSSVNELLPMVMH